MEMGILDDLASCMQGQSRAPAPQSLSDTSDNLALVDENVLEEQLALETMCNKAHANAQDVMLTLAPRLEKVLGMSLTDSHPLSPSTLTNIISRNCKELEIDLSELLLVYKYLDKHVFSKLPDALNEINRALQSQDILPDLSSKEAMKVKRKDRLSPANQERSFQTKTANQTYNDTSGSNISEGREQLNNRSSSTQASRVEILNTLDMIAHQLTCLEAANQAPPLSSAALLKNISETLEKTTSKALSEEDMDIINLVAMLFEFILEDSNLAPEMQALIGRLQLPVLKAILKDPKFFNDHQHPTRTFLDRLAKAAIGWTATGDQLQNALYSEIKAIVITVSRSEEQNRELFVKADEQLRLLCEKEEKKRALLEQRTRLTEEGRIKSRIAQNFVESTLQSLTKEKELPNIVTELLHGPWRRVMFLAFLRDSEEHNWESTRRAAEELVWCSENHHSDIDRQRWVTVVPKLLKQIAAGLEKTSFDSTGSRELTEKVRKTLAALFRESSLSNQVPKTAQHKKSPAAPKTSVDTSNPRDFSASSIGKRFIRAPQQMNISIGSWIEVNTQELERKRYKLVSYIIEADTYVFVDRLGLHALEYSRQQLSKALSEKQITLLEKGALVDRALSHVMANFKSH